MMTQRYRQSPAKPGLHLSVISLLLLVITISGCMAFDNPVELEEGESRASGELTVTIKEVAVEATVLNVELLWVESGKSGEDILRKMLPVETGISEYTVTFDGLGAGGGRARAASSIGTRIWQNYVESENVLLGDGESSSVEILLALPDGDIDEDGDSDGDITDGDEDIEPDAEATDGDVTDGDGTDGDITDGDADGDEDGEQDPDIEYDPTYLDVPYSPNTDYVNDGVVNPTEYYYAEMIEIPGESEDVSQIYIMHGTSFIFVGASLINGVANDPPERLSLAFDPDQTVENDEFILSLERGNTLRFCETFNGEPCNRIEPPLIWIGGQSAFARGWQGEITVPYGPLHITAGEASEIGFAFVNDMSGGNISAWPEYADLTNPATWGTLTSSDNWNWRDYPTDGDDDDEPDIQETDGDVTDGDITDGDSLDGDDDIDLDSETDPDPEPEIQEGQPGYCQTGTQVCEQINGSWYLGTCNGATTDYNFATCSDPNICTDDFCDLAEGGCYHINNSAPCSDNNACTELDECSGGSCVGSPISCDDGNDCTNDFSNPATPSCCSHTNKDDLTACDDGKTCTISTACSAGQCVGEAIAGCCEGHEDMVLMNGGFCIDKYEAVIGEQSFVEGGCLDGGPGTRYGMLANDFPAGFGPAVTPATQTVFLYACNRYDTLPSAYLSINQARTACINSGKRLCGKAEFREVCGGASDESYPYGNTYVGTSCNGLDLSGSGLRSGSATECVRDGIYDLSGNFKEWVEETQACGGSYFSGEFGLTCSSCEQLSPGATNPDLGFRCCADPE